MFDEKELESIIRGDRINLKQILEKYMCCDGLIKQVMKAVRKLENHCVNYGLAKAPAEHEAELKAQIEKYEQEIARLNGLVGVFEDRNIELTHSNKNYSNMLGYAQKKDDRQIEEIAKLKKELSLSRKNEAHFIKENKGLKVDLRRVKERLYSYSKK